MTSLRKILLAFGFTSAIAVTTTLGQVITFDENGKSSSPFGPLPFGVAPSPGGPPTLFYVLPFLASPGDVMVTEFAGQTQPSDLLRFDHDRVWVWSEQPEPGDPFPPDLADTGVPAPGPIFAGPFPEIGFEGMNGIIYIPGPGMPGFPVSGVAGVEYHFVSDVPEPAGVLIATLGGGMLLLLRQRFQARRN